MASARTRTGPEREALINELFTRHYERVARWALRFCGNQESAADLAQDVFLKAHRHLHTFKGTARFSTWLYSIVRNESISRSQRAAPPMDDESALLEVASMDAQPDELAERRTQGQRVRDFLAATLDPLERTVYTLHYGDEMPLDAITRLLGLDNPSGAKASIVSARRKIARAAQRLRARGERL